MNSQNRTSPLLHLLPQSVAAILLLALIWQFAEPRDIAFWIGLTLTTVSAGFFLTARFQLGRSFAVAAKAKHLVIHGIYSRIRNPMYVFSGLMLLGAVIAFQRVVFFVIPAILIPLQIFRAHREAKALEAGFGNAYREYRRGTWF